MFLGAFISYRAHFQKDWEISRGSSVYLTQFAGMGCPFGYVEMSVYIRPKGREIVQARPVD